MEYEGCFLAASKMDTAQAKLAWNKTPLKIKFRRGKDGPTFIQVDIFDQQYYGSPAPNQTMSKMFVIT